MKIHAMTHEESFLQSIREAPADDAPRLIYADWLEEHGQADRAEFIRVQCRLVGLTHEATERSVLLARAESLLRRNWNEWVGPLRDIVGPWRDRYGESWLGEEFHPESLRRFHRGFVDGIFLDTDTFRRHARVLRLLIPRLHTLHLWRAGGRTRALANAPELAGLCVLAFLDYYDAPLKAHDATELSASPHLYGLSVLRMGWNSLGDEGVEALTSARWLASVIELDLSDNGLSDRAARSLAASPYLGNVRTLRLGRNFLSAEGVAVLTNSRNLRSLEHLECSSGSQRNPLSRAILLGGGQGR
jgi:uncharacterized protein (TIGR02996 family)